MRLTEALLEMCNKTFDKSVSEVALATACKYVASRQSPHHASLDIPSPPSTAIFFVTPVC
jgi:hypothetical protein